MDKINIPRAAHQITDLNMDIQLLLVKFNSFREEFNVVDKNLMKNLEMVYQEIEEFLDSEPKLIETEQRTSFDPGYLIDNGIFKFYACGLCEIELGERSKDICKHVEHNSRHLRLKQTTKLNLSSNHKSDKSKSVEKETVRSRRGGRRRNQLEDSRRLPKKAKSFISSDFGIYLDNAVITGKKLMQIPQYKEIENSFKDSLKTIYPDIKVYYFGSRINGLGNQDSDLDVFLDIGNVFHSYDSKEKHEEIIKKLNIINGRLSKVSVWKNFQSVKNARVPILKVYNSKARIECDISFSNGFGQLNSLLLKHFFEIQPMCFKVCLFLKRWLKDTTLKFQFSTYSFILMGIYFFQTKNLLPSVKVLQAGMKEPLNIGPWQGDFIQKELKELKLEKSPDGNGKCLEYLMEFFKFVADFDYHKLIMCPYLGRTIVKSSIHTTELENLPRYAEYYKIDPEINSIQLDKVMCVMDPLEHNHNVTKGISDVTFQIFRQYCVETYNELKNIKVN